jgi:acetyl-CoA carboxylase beta subunit
MFDPDNLETMHKEQATPRPSRMKKIEEVQYLSSASGKTASVSPDLGDDDKVEELNDKGDEKNPSEVTPLRNKVDPLKKRKFSPPKPSSWNKSKAIMTKMKTMLTVYDFDFIIVALNDASLEIVEKQEAKQEEMYDRIEVEI